MRVLPLMLGAAIYTVATKTTPPETPCPGGAGERPVERLEVATDSDWGDGLPWENGRRQCFGGLWDRHLEIGVQDGADFERTARLDLSLSALMGIERDPLAGPPASNPGAPRAVSPFCRVSAGGTVLLNAPSRDSLIVEYSLRGTKLREWGRPVLDPTPFGLAQAAFEDGGWRAFNLGQIIVQADGGFLFVFSHLPLVHRYRPDGSVTVLRYGGEWVEETFRRFDESGYSCDCSKHHRLGVAVPHLVRSSALVDERLYLLIGPRLYVLDKSELQTVDWPIDSDSARELLPVGQRLGVRLHSGQVVLLRADSRGPTGEAAASERRIL